MSKLAEGYTCQCGAFHKYPAYVYAHWCEVLTHTCDKCGTKHSILKGNAVIESLFVESDESDE